MRAMVCALVSTLAALAGCFSPDLSRVRWTCTGDGRPDDCPPGLICEANYCVATPAGDAGDAGVDASADLAPASGCSRGGGLHLGNNVWACEGPFARGKAATLCGASHDLCAAADAVPAAACSSAPGFFISRATLYTNSFNQCRSITSMLVSCTEGMYQFRLGCGQGGPVAALECEHSCGGFSRALSCTKAAAAGYSCGSGPSAGADQSDVQAFGALCCPR